MENHQQVSGKFVAYAKADLNAMYVNCLAGPAGVLPLHSFPAHYFSLPDTVAFEQQKYMRSLPHYGQAAYLQNKYFGSETAHHSESPLQKQFTGIVNQYTHLTRDQLMAIKLKEYVGKEDPYFDEAYMLFLKLCSNEVIQAVVKDAITASLVHADDDDINLKWGDVPLHTLVYDRNGTLKALA